MSRAKVAVTDELLDAYVNRPLARYVVRAVERTSVTPNQLTLASAVWGTIAGLCFASEQRGAALMGAIALFLCMVFDCSDGQLARARGGGSVVGRIFDGYADYWVALWLHIGILTALGNTGVELFGHTLNYPERFLFVLAAGVSMGVNSGRFDFYKQRYLAHTGLAREPESPQLFIDEADRSASFIERAALRLFALYVRVQQRNSEFRQGVAAARYTASDPLRIRRFEDENGVLVRLWSLSGPTMHNAAMCATACLLPYFPHAWVGYCLFALVFVNAYTVVLWVLQRRVLRREPVAVAPAE
jgi:hypothetical protein